MFTIETIENQLFTEWAVQWLALVKPTVKGNTFAAGYKNPVENHIIPYFGDVLLSEVTKRQVQVYLNTKAEVYSLDFIKKHKSCLVQLFAMAVDDGLCDKNPACNLKLPRTKQREEKDVYTQEQADLIFSYAYTHRFGVEIQLMLETGIRRGELLGLQWRDVDLNLRVLYIRRAAASVPDRVSGKIVTVLEEPKTVTSKRDIPLSERMCGILKKRQRTSVFVFPNINGDVCNPRTWSRRHYDVFMDDMHSHYSEQGIDIPQFCPHQLRHTRASLWVNQDLNLHAVAKVLGHADLNMLHKRYIHTNTTVLREQLRI